MIVLGHEIPDAAILGALPAAGGLLGWFGRQRTAAKRGDLGDRRLNLDEFNALIRAYHEQNAALNRDVGRLTAEMSILRGEMKDLHAQNLSLERENTALRGELATLRGELERYGHKRAGRRDTDVEVAS